MAGMYPEIETDRLLLRQFRRCDLDAFAAFASDEATMRFLGGACDRDEAWRRLAANAGHWVLCGYGPWAIEEKATGDFVGRAGMWYRETWPGPEAVWALTPDKRGRGFATEAARAVIQFAFESLGLGQVPSIIDPENAPSIRVAERLGQLHTGELMRNGTRRLVYTIDKPEA